VGIASPDADGDEEGPVLTPTREQNISRIVEALAERFAGRVDRATIEAEVDQRYDELCSTSAFDDFVPVLAARLSIDDLREQAEPEPADELAARLTAPSDARSGEPGTDPARAVGQPEVTPSIPIAGR
jgi:hypothetical protein